MKSVKVFHAHVVFGGGEGASWHVQRGVGHRLSWLFSINDFKFKRLFTNNVTDLSLTPGHTHTDSSWLPSLENEFAKPPMFGAGCQMDGGGAIVAVVGIKWSIDITGFYN